MGNYPFKVQDRVHIIASPHNVGTVTNVGVSGFSVTFDGHERLARGPRARFTYEWSSAHLFKVGNPKAPKAEETRETING